MFTALLLTLVGMVGFRLDRLPAARRSTEAMVVMVIWGLGVLLSIAAAWVVQRGAPEASLGYFAFAWLFYYAGNTLVLATSLRHRWRARWGDERAYRWYEALVGLMFLNQGLALGAISEVGAGLEPSLTASSAVSAISLLLVASGFAVKVWATLHAGLDIYYYRDMFLGRPVDAYVVTGPYRWFRNPMYSVGNLQSYGLALLHWSVVGLFGAALFHASIYAFYLMAERPAVRELYRN